jgi:hypothetical protein
MMKLTEFWSTRIEMSGEFQGWLTTHKGVGFIVHFNLNKRLDTFIGSANCHRFLTVIETVEARNKRLFGESHRINHWR